MTVKEYGQLIRRKRIGQGVTQEQYAKLAGVELETIRAVENNELDPPLSLALKLASGLGWVIR